MALAPKSPGDVVPSAGWNELIGIPSSTQPITAAGDTIQADARLIVLNPDADYTMTSTPTITNGSYIGQLLRIICADGEGNTVTLQDQGTLANSNIYLNGGAIAKGVTGRQMLVFGWNGSNWVEEGVISFGTLTIGEDGTNVAIFASDGNLSISNASPEILLKNLTAEDTSGGRESGIRFKGIQSGSEESTLARILASHAGTDDNEKCNLEFYVNDGNDGNSPTRVAYIASDGSYNLLNGILGLEETTTPGPVGGRGKVYTKNDNLLYVQTGDGVEHTVSFDTMDYAGIAFNDNGDVTTVLLVDAFEPITDFDTDMPEAVSNGDNTTYNITIGGTGIYELTFHTSATSAGNTKTYEIYVFSIGASTQAITGATQANPCVLTATSHPYNNGDRVKIIMAAGMTELDGQIYTVAGAGVNDFQLNDDNGGTINSGAYGAYSDPGTAQLATEIIVVHSHRTYGVGADVGMMGGGGIASLTGSDTLEMHVKGITDNSNITFEHASFYIRRLS